MLKVNYIYEPLDGTNIHDIGKLKSFYVQYALQAFTSMDFQN